MEDDVTMHFLDLPKVLCLHLHVPRYKQRENVDLFKSGAHSRSKGRCEQFYDIVPDTLRLWDHEGSPMMTRYLLSMLKLL